MNLPTVYEIPSGKQWNYKWNECFVKVVRVNTQTVKECQVFKSAPKGNCKASIIYSESYESCDMSERPNLDEPGRCLSGPIRNITKDFIPPEDNKLVIEIKD
jgi:hypothetical protein